MKCIGKTKTGEKCKNICKGKRCHVHALKSFRFGDVSEREAQFAILLSILTIAKEENVDGDDAFTILSEKLGNPDLTNEIIERIPIFNHARNMDLLTLISTFHIAINKLSPKINAIRIKNTRFYIIDNSEKDSFKVVKDYF